MLPEYARHAVQRDRIDARVEKTAAGGAVAGESQELVGVVRVGDKMVDCGDFYGKMEMCIRWRKHSGDGNGQNPFAKKVG